MIGSMNAVCCNCKKVVSGPPVADETSHTICLDCVKELYPDVYREMTDEFEDIHRRR